MAKRREHRARGAQWGRPTAAWGALLTVAVLTLGAGCRGDVQGTTIEQVGIGELSPPDLTSEGLSCATDADCEVLPIGPCEVAACSADLFCEITAREDGIECSDNNPCTQGDECVSGACIVGPNTCECASDGDCAAFQDGDLCNGLLVCLDASCAVAPNSVVTCEAAPSGGCSEAACNPTSGICESSSKPDGVACDDGNACTTGDTCKSGGCLGDTTMGCPDAGPCVLGVCDPDAGCQAVASVDGTSCSDGNPCTGADVCSSGTCIGGAITCPCTVDTDCLAFDVDKCDAPMLCVEGLCTASEGPGVQCPPSEGKCLVSGCDPDTGACEEIPLEDGASCGSGGGCAAEAICAGGVCLTPGGSCDDDNPCTVDLCDPIKGCGYEPEEGPCSDGDVCTVGDTCAEGECVGLSEACDCASDADCSGGKYDPCLGTWTCISGQCGVILGTAVDCSGLDSPCTIGTCDPQTLLCQATPVEAGTTCDDGVACTVGAACAAGVCTGAVPDPCDDGNPCTNDSCSVASGCSNVPNAAPCDDGNACTKNDLCVGGGCFGGAAVKCLSDDECLVASCDPGAGCVEVPAAPEVLCDDGNSCTGEDHCSDGSCVGQSICECQGDEDCPQPQSACDGVVHCVEQSCVLDPETKVVCGGSSDCKVISCDPATGACVTSVVDDGAPCADAGACKQPGVCAFGACSAGDVDCDDGNQCTVNTCNLETGECLANQVVGGLCNDSDPCTTSDLCVQGTCVGGGTLACEDGDACTLGVCVPGIGCEFDATGGCDDDDGCTVDSCDPVAGCVHDPVLCPQPEEPCLAAACSPLSGACTEGLAQDGKDCEDETPCGSGPGGCQFGVCVPDNTLDCDDDNPCTADGCGDEGCTHSVLVGASCEDGDSCTAFDVCSEAGTCVGEAYECDDDDECTTDYCADGHCTYDAIEGCSTGVPCNLSAGSPCDDGDPATLADVCIEALCRGFERFDVPTPGSGEIIYHRADHTLDRWFIATIDVDDEGVIGGDITTWAGGDELMVHPEAAIGGAFRGLHRGFAVSTDADFLQFDPSLGDKGTWRDDTPLVQAFSAGDNVVPRDLWSSNVTTQSGQVSLWMVGEIGDGFWMRGCSQVPLEGGGVSAVCHGEGSNADESVLPETVAGTDCGGCKTPHMVLGADYLNGYQGGVPQYFNDTLEHSGDVGDPWGYGYFDDQDGPTMHRDNAAVGDGRYLQAGHYGYLRQRKSNGSWSFNLQLKQNQSQRHFEGAWSGAGLVATVAWRSTGDNQRTLELWTIPTSGNLADGAQWTIHTLGTVTGTFSALYDLQGTSEGEMVGVGGTLLSSDDGSTYGGVIFHRDP